MFPHLTRPPPLDLSPLPLTYLLPTHLTPESHLEKQNLLRRCNCRLTDAAFDAQLFITAIASPQRAKLELRKKLVRVVNGGDKGGALNVDVDTKNAKDITVVRLSWLTDSLADNKLLDFEPYVVLRGRAVVETRPNTPTSTPPPRKMGQETEEEMQRKLVMESKKRKAILQAAMEEGKGKKSRYGGGRRAKEAAAEELVAFSKPVTFEAATMEKKPPALLRRSTSEYEEEEKMLEGKDMPEWIRKKVSFGEKGEGLVISSLLTD